MFSPEGSAFLEVGGLSKVLGGRRVLDDVSFALGRGSLVWVAGANGAGKSTLLRCLAGLARFTGVVRLAGERVPGGVAVRRRIGYLPQAPGLLPTATVDETLRYYAHLRRSDPPDLGPGLLPPADARIGELSGGQVQRVALAIALTGSPDLLLLDEPTANLDPESCTLIRDELIARAGRGSLVLVAGPTSGDLTAGADAVLWLEDGRVAAARRELRRSPAEVTV